MLEEGDKVRIDQEDLETVIPTVDGTVMILNGPGKGYLATLLALNTDKYCAKVKLTEGSRKGEILSNIQYEDISKADKDFFK